jgi:hypothetical protein
MPAISTGRNAGSARGRSAGRHKTKRDAVIQQHQTTRQTQAQQRAAAPANRKAQREKERKDVLTKTSGSRQLGGRSSRAYEPKTKPRESGLTVAGPRGMSVKHVEGKSVGDAVKTLWTQAGKQRGTGKQPKMSAIDMTLASAIPAAGLANLIGGKPRKIVQNTGKDAYQFPIQIVPSTIQTTAAVNEARKGNFKPLNEMRKQFTQTDPVWNALAAAGNVATGDLKEAGRRIKVAGKSAEEHPGLLALELYGAKGATGRFVTRGANATRRVASGAERLTGKGKSAPAQAASRGAGRVKDRAAKIGNTERAPRRLPGTNLVEHRKYSDDAITRAFQKRRDKHRSRKAGDLYQEAQRLRDEGQHTKAAEKRADARETDPQILKDRHLKRAVDEHADASEQIRRHGLSELLHAMRKEKITGRQVKRGGPLASIFAQKITKADIGELKAYRDRLIGEAKTMDPDADLAKLQANEKLVTDLTEAIKGVESGKVDMGRIQSIADRYIERSRASQQGLIDRKLIDPHEAERAALTPHAVVNMDARREPALLEAVAKTAGKEAKRAKNKVGNAKSALNRLSGKHTEQAKTEPHVVAKREAALNPGKGATNPKTTNAEGELREAGVRRQRSRGAGRPSRGERVTDYLKRMENLSDDELHALIEREDARTAGRAKAEGNVKTAKKTAKKTKKAASVARDRANRNPLVLPGGKPLTTEAINASAEGVPAFISNRPRGIGKPYVASDKAPKIPGDKRSGEAAAQGTFDADPETLARQELRTHSIESAFDSFQRLMNRFGYRGKGEDLVQHDTFKDADGLARRLKAEDGREWVPVRLNPLGADQNQLRAMLEGTSDKTIADLLETAGHESDAGGPWVVLPGAAVKQMARHMKNLDPADAERFVQAAFSNWRKIVLSLSIPWVLGNTAEASLRSALNLVGPRSLLTGIQARKDAPKLAEALGKGKSKLEQDRLKTAAALGEARTVGSGRTALVDRAHMHRDPTQFDEGAYRTLLTNMDKVLDTDLKVGGKQLPISARLIPGAWKVWTDFSMQIVNKSIENTFQTAMLGKAIRNQRRGAGQRVAAVRPKALMTPRARALSEKAAKEQAEGLLSEDTAAALGREIDRMYGRYSKMSPLQRRIVANYTPFIAWMLNAGKFVGRLPEDHPVFTAVMAAQERASEEWRKEHGLAKFMGGEAKGQVPGWLQGSIPGKHGEHFRAPTKFTPFSLASDPGGTIAQQVNPQFNGILNALGGKDWKGDDLKDADGNKIEDPATFAYALKAFVESTIPGVSLGEQIARKGPRDYVIDAATGRVAAKKKKGGGGGQVKKRKAGFDFEAAQGGGGDQFDFKKAGVAGGSDQFDFEKAGY